MSTKGKMLYLMHIDWNWIKQRPQYIEEALEDYFDVTIMCPRNYRLKQYNDKPNCTVFYSIPFIRRYPGLWKIDAFRKKRRVHRYIRKEKPDCIYLTSPEFGKCIPSFYSGVVIYDCMDDMLAFNKEKHYVDRVSAQEKEAIKKSDIILATSNRLKEILARRYPERKHDIVLVRNGYDGEIAIPHLTERKGRYTFCYFGTISHWFNFDFILKSLNDFPDIEYMLVGPVEGGTTIPSHDRIKHIPPVQHDQLEEVTMHADAFIMPFQINELILSVDPVKLYEYINFNKNILCVEYPEITRFSDFVFFYTDYDSFAKQIREMKNLQTVKYTIEERRLFLARNNWQKRGDQILDEISKGKRKH